MVEVLSQKINICVKINCNLFSCDKTVDSHGDTFDFMLSERRDEEAATAFFKQLTIMAFLITHIERLLSLKK